MLLSSGCSSGRPVEFERPALVVGHPGHELRVFGWMDAYKPLVHLITDGSGRNGVARTPSTAALLKLIGAQQGEVFGHLSDAEIYRAILERNHLVFLPLVDSLASSFLNHETSCVAGDAAEGFNPTHDLCRILINAAVLLAERTTAKQIANFEIRLAEWEENCPDAPHGDGCLHWTLDDRELEKKVASAEQYAGLSFEVQRAIAQRGREYFRMECLQRTATTDLPNPAAGKPAYEIWGEQRVAEGRYQTVIRFEHHVLPIMQAILNYASSATLDRSLVVAKR